MAQRLGRQAVTALGRRPGPRPFSHPHTPPRLAPDFTGSQGADPPSGQPGAVHFRLPSFREALAAAALGGRSVLGVGAEGHQRSGADDNPHPHLHHQGPGC